jgi:hypothetical protein
MSRSVLALDRVLTFLLGLVLLVAGAAAITWQTGQLTRVWPAAPDELRLGPAASATGAAWWPWAAGIAGVAAILLGLWWLLSHIPRRAVATVALPGADGRGSLRINPSAATTTAADMLEKVPGVRSARGTMQDRRGELVAIFRATLEPTADLGAVVAAVERTSAELGHVLGIPAARCHIHLNVARRGRTLPRAR